MLKSVIADISTGESAKVDQNALVTTDAGIPPSEGGGVVRPFRQYMTLDGTPAGTNSMIVDGSVNNQHFCVVAAQDSDRYVTSLSFEIAAPAALLNEFGTGNALTNGCRLFYSDPILGDVDIHDALKTNWDIVRLCQGAPSFGDDSTAFRAKNAVGTDESFIPVLDLVKTFGLSWGIRLPRSTEAKIVLSIRDDLTGVGAGDPDLSSFNAIMYGFDRLL
jgi:hypothetical protein